MARNTGNRLMASPAPFAAGLMVVVSLLGAVVARGDSDTPTPPGAVDSSGAFGAVVEADLRAEARANWLRSDDAKTERLASRTAFARESAVVAEASAEREFGSMVTSPLWRVPWAGRDDSHVVGFRGDHVAELRVDGRPGVSLVDSTIPLSAVDDAGVRRAVNVALHDRGGFFEPENPAISSALPKQLAGGFSLANGDLQIELDGASEVAGERLGERVFYGNAATDTDWIAGATPTGVGLYAQLRSPKAPSKLDLDLQTARGEPLELTPDGRGGVEIRRDGHVVGTISPPAALDAQQVEVPVRYELEGKTVRLVVDHTDRDLAYPVLVDPVIDLQNWYQNAAVPMARGWHFGTWWPDRFFSSTDGGYGRGLYLVMGAGRLYGHTEFGNWWSKAPGTSHIYYALYYYGHHMLNSTVWQGTELPICQVRLLAYASGATDTGTSWWDDGPSLVGPQYGSGPHAACSAFIASSVHQCVRSDCQPSYDRSGNYAELIQSAYGTGVRSGWNIDYLGSATLFLADPEDPSIAGGPASTAANPDAPWSITASDPGFGVRKVEISAPSYPGWNQATTNDYSCLGTAGAECPASVQISRTYGNLPPGTSTIRVSTFDAGNRMTTKDWQVTVPTTETTFELASSVTPDTVVQAAASAGAGLLDMTHSGVSPGGYVVGQQTAAAAVVTYKQSYAAHVGAAVTPPVTTFALRGSVPTSSLGPLASNVATRSEFDPASTNSIDTATYDPEPLTNYPDDLAADDAYAETLAIDSRVDNDAVAASGAKLWAPTYGKAWTYNVSGNPLPRRFLLTFTWTKQSSIDDFDRANAPDWAYEHDFKLINRDNPGALRDPLCFGNDDNFWAKHDDLYWYVNKPLEIAKPYLDTRVSDPCDMLDFTIGLYHPIRLRPGQKYEIVIQAKAGTKAVSPYTHYGQKLGKVCDVRPGCVNPTSTGGRSQPYVGESKGRAPECRRWRKGRASRPC